MLKGVKYLLSLNSNFTLRSVDALTFFDFFLFFPLVFLLLRIPPLIEKSTGG